MTRRAAPVVGSTGRSEHVQLEGIVRRVADQLHGQVGAVADEAATYAPASSTDWSGSPPSTIAEALDRIAAALGPIP
jgi:hypothetical protein